MQTSKQEKIEKLLDQLDTMMHLSYQIHKETDYCNHTYVIKELTPEYKLARKQFSETLKELLDNNSAS